MINVEEFKNWLLDNTAYSGAVISDTVSRMKRADAILPWFEDDIYQYKLERLDAYKVLTVSVRSQIKKAVRLYFEYYQSRTRL